MSVATPSEVNPSDNDAADLQDLLSDYEWELMQSESLDTSIDNIAVRLIIQPILYSLLLCANFLLALILGCLLCVIFSRFFRN